MKGNLIKCSILTLIGTLVTSVIALAAPGDYYYGIGNNLTRIKASEVGNKRNELKLNRNNLYIQLDENTIVKYKEYKLEVLRNYIDTNDIVNSVKIAKADANLKVSETVATQMKQLDSQVNYDIKMQSATWKTAGLDVLVNNVVSTDDTKAGEDLVIQIADINNVAGVNHIELDQSFNYTTVVSMYDETTNQQVALSKVAVNTRAITISAGQGLTEDHKYKVTINNGAIILIFGDKNTKYTTTKALSFQFNVSGIFEVIDIY